MNISIDEHLFKKFIKIMWNDLTPDLQQSAISLFDLNKTNQSTLHTSNKSANDSLSLEIRKQIDHRYLIMEKQLQKNIDSQLFEINTRTIKMVRTEARNILLNMLKTDIDIKKIVDSAIVSMSKTGFKPVVDAVYTSVYTKFTNKLVETLTNKITLKTSDLQLLTQEIRFAKFDQLQLRKRGFTVKNGELTESV